MTAGTVLALDTMLDDLDVEEQAAQELGWSVRRWSGSPDELGEANAVVHVRTPVDRTLISALRECKVIGRFGTGLDSVDLVAAERAGMAVVNVRDYCLPELAGLTVGLALSLLHELGPRHDNTALQALRWQDYVTSHPRPGATTVLVIGYGAIGASVASALGALGLRVLVNSRRPVNGAGVETAQLAEGLAAADIVFLQRELSPCTRGFFDAQLIARMKPTGIVVNTARKDLMDQAAVVAALREGRLGGVGLDALLTPDDPLHGVLDHPRVLVTPHVGWYSDHALTELRRRTVRSTIQAHPNAETHTEEQDV